MIVHYITLYCIIELTDRTFFFRILLCTIFQIDSSITPLYRYSFKLWFFVSPIFAAHWIILCCQLITYLLEVVRSWWVSEGLYMIHVFIHTLRASSLMELFCRCASLSYTKIFVLNRWGDCMLPFVNSSKKGLRVSNAWSHFRITLELPMC
jgi:hypothetical protein